MDNLERVKTKILTCGGCYFHKQKPEVIGSNYCIKEGDIGCSDGAGKNYIYKEKPGNKGGVDSNG